MHPLACGGSSDRVVFATTPNFSRRFGEAGRRLGGVKRLMTSNAKYSSADTRVELENNRREGVAGNGDTATYVLVAWH
jgi:hypothetical protein